MIPYILNVTAGPFVLLGIIVIILVVIAVLTLIVGVVFLIRYMINHSKTHRS